MFCVHFDLASVKNRPDAIVSDGDQRATSWTLLKHAVARLPCSGAICFSDHNPERDAVLRVSRGRGKCAVWTAKRYGCPKTQKRRNTRAKTTKTQQKTQHYKKQQKQRSLQHLNILETGNDIKENMLLLCFRFYRSQVQKTIRIFSDWFFTSFAFG